MNQLGDTEYSAYVGIDWASAKHDICVQAADGEVVGICESTAGDTGKLSVRLVMENGWKIDDIKFYELLSSSAGLPGSRSMDV